LLFDLKVPVLECSIIVDLLVASLFTKVTVRPSKLFIQESSLFYVNHDLNLYLHDKVSKVPQFDESDSPAIHNMILTSIYVEL